MRNDCRLCQRRQPQSGQGRARRPERRTARRSFSSDATARSNRNRDARKSLSAPAKPWSRSVAAAAATARRSSVRRLASIDDVREGWISRSRAETSMASRFRRSRNRRGCDGAPAFGASVEALSSNPEESASMAGRKARVTLTDIAAAAHVSVTTASNVANGRLELMSAPTRDRVEAVMRELNYRPDEGARSLRLAQRRAIGLIIVDDSPGSSPTR